MRINPHITFISSAILLMLTLGCSSTRTYQRVNHIIYPEKRLPDQTSEITVIHTIPLEKPQITSSTEPSAHDHVNDQPTQFGLHDKIGYLVNMVARELKRSKFYVIKERQLSQNEIKLWDANKVNSYISSNQGVLLVLDELHSDYDFKSEKIRKHQLDEAGQDYYIDAYEATRRYVIDANWNIYHGESPEPIYAIKNQGKKTVKTQGLRKDQTIEKLDSVAQHTERFLLDSLATDLASLIMPLKVFDSWSYYVKGSEILKEGKKYMELDHLNEAMQMYKAELRKEDDKKIIARLHYNLAIIHDIRGESALAFQYAEKALLADNKYLHKTLYDKLKIQNDRANKS